MTATSDLTVFFDIAARHGHYIVASSTILKPHLWTCPAAVAASKASVDSPLFACL